MLGVLTRLVGEIERGEGGDRTAAKVSNRRVRMVVAHRDEKQTLSRTAQPYPRLSNVPGRTSRQPDANRFALDRPGRRHLNRWHKKNSADLVLTVTRDPTMGVRT